MITQSVSGSVNTALNNIGYSDELSDIIKVQPELYFLNYLGGTMDYNSNPRHFTEVISSKMTVFKKNKDNLLPCSLKTE